jgi:hypothetical protein
MGRVFNRSSLYLSCPLNDVRARSERFDSLWIRPTCRFWTPTSRPPSRKHPTAWPLFCIDLTSQSTTAQGPTRMSNSTSRTPSASHTSNMSNTRLSTVPTSATKARQLSHLHAQLAQLTAHMSDLENLLRMTAVQAEGMRGLGGYAGGM